jgi:hypothetical protein
MKKLLPAVLLGLVALGSAPAEPAARGLFLDQSLQAASNPLGVQFVSRLYYRIPLGLGQGLLWESAKVDLGALNELSPAYDFAGAYIDIEPIAFFDLELAARAAGYTKALGYGFNDLPGLQSGFDGGARRDLTQRSTGGYLLSLTPTLKAAFGPVVLLDSLRLRYFDIGSGAGFFFDIVNNVPLAKRGWEVQNDAYALADLGGGILAGLADTYLLVPESGYVVHHANLVAIVSRPLRGGMSFYAAAQGGIFLQDRYLKYSLRFAGLAGLVISL